MKINKEDALNLISKGAAHDEPPKEMDSLYLLEKDALSDAQKQIEIDILKQQLSEWVDNHKLRVEFTRKIFYLVCAWLLCVIAGLTMSGYSFYTAFYLPDKVLMVFIITTTISVLGLFVIVAKWMFHQNNIPSNIKK